MVKKFITFWGFSLVFIALGQLNVFGQEAAENLPVPEFDLPAQQRMADELREAYLNLRRHLCDKPGESFEALLGRLIVAQHRTLWAASGEFDGANVLDPTLVEYTRTLQPFYVKKDEIRGFLLKAAREKPENAAEIQGIVNRLDENSRRFAEAAGSKGFGRTIFAVYANGAVLAELDKDLPVAKLRKFGVPEGDYAGRRNRALMALTDALGIIYPYAVRRINNRIPAAAPRFSVYYSTDYVFPKEIIKSFAATAAVSFDVDKLESLQDETWHTYAKTEFNEAEQQRLRGNCQKETVRIMFVPSRRGDAEKALKLLGDNSFEAKLQPVAENLVPEHLGKVYFQNKGNYERANIISRVIRNIEKVSPDNGSGGPGTPDYSLWIIGKTEPVSSSVPNLSGVWTAAGYFCGGAAATQRIRIEQTGNRITAFKIVGTVCVKAGELTFRGTVAGNSFEVEFRSKQPDGTDDRFIRGRGRIVNPNRLEITGTGPNTITLTRPRE